MTDGHLRPSQPPPASEHRKLPSLAAMRSAPATGCRAQVHATVPSNVSQQTPLSPLLTIGIGRLQAIFRGIFSSKETNSPARSKQRKTQKDRNQATPETTHKNPLLHFRPLFQRGTKQLRGLRPSLADVMRDGARLDEPEIARSRLEARCLAARELGPELRRPLRVTTGRARRLAVFERRQFELQSVDLRCG